MTSAKAATAAYEAWLGEHIPLVPADLAAKHEVLRHDAFGFLRGTYYLWLDRVAELAPELLGGVRTPIVGDLHLENFGTWRDPDGDLRWGVNDLDELATGPWVLDLLRLAVSAAIAPHVSLKGRQIVDTLLDAYSAATPGPAVRLADHRHLRALMPAAKDPAAFMRRLASGEAAADVPPHVAEAVAATAPAGWEPVWHVRSAGVGSLGQRRRVAVGPAGHETLAREVKQLGPGAADWLAGRHAGLPVPAPGVYAAVRAALRGAPALLRVDGWQVRPLSPEEVRVDLASLDPDDATRVLASMAAAAADVHGVDPAAATRARAEAGSYDRDAFRGYVKTLVRAVEADFDSWR